MSVFTCFGGEIIAGLLGLLGTYLGVSVSSEEELLSELESSSELEATAPLEEELSFEVSELLEATSAIIVFLKLLGTGLLQTGCSTFTAT